jgi:hypothetical protein
MAMTRRAFLGSATLVTAAAVSAAVLEVPTAAVAATPERTASLTRATFRPALGRSVSAAAPGTRARLRLVTLGDLHGAPAGSPDSFLLQFTSSTPLPDGIYSVAHPAFGTRQLFLAPVYSTERRRYEAVVNQTAPPC